MRANGGGVTGMPRPSGLTVATVMVVVLNALGFGHGFYRLTRPPQARPMVPYLDMGASWAKPPDLAGASKLVFAVKAVGGFGFKVAVPAAYQAVPGGTLLGLLALVLLAQLGRGLVLLASPEARKRSMLGSLTGLVLAKKWLKVVEQARLAEKRYSGRLDEQDVLRLKLMIAQAFSGLKKPQLALVEYREALALVPSSFDALAGVASALYESESDVPEEWIEPAFNYLRRQDAVDDAMFSFFIFDLVKKAALDKKAL